MVGDVFPPVESWQQGQRRGLAIGPIVLDGCDNDPLMAAITAATNHVVAEHVANLGRLIEMSTDGALTRVSFERHGEAYVMTAHPCPGGFNYEIHREEKS